MFYFEQQNHQMLFKLCGEKHQYTVRPFLFFLKNSKPKKKLFNDIANKSEAINIFGF